MDIPDKSFQNIYFKISCLKNKEVCIGSLKLLE